MRRLGAAIFSRFVFASEICASPAASLVSQFPFRIRNILHIISGVIDYMAERIPASRPGLDEGARSVPSPGPINSALSVQPLRARVFFIILC